MPWRGSNRFVFNRAWILLYAPVGSGVYAIHSFKKWLYVGEAAGIRSRLLRHLAGKNTCIAQHMPTHFAFETVPAAARMARQRDLIAEFQPACNEPTVPEQYAEQRDGG